MMKFTKLTSSVTLGVLVDASSLASGAGPGNTQALDITSSTVSKYAAASPPAYGDQYHAWSAADAMSFCLRNQYVNYLTAANGESWHDAIQPYNLRLPYVPAIVVIPESAAQVATAVRCASHGPGAVLPPGDSPKVEVQARSGGHSYAAYSLGGQNGSMVIDLKLLDQVSVDESGLATVGGGVKLGNMVQELYAQGMRAMPHGTCPGIGIGGHATHGGYGLSSRSWGLALDTIVGMEVVLANASVVKTSATCYPEIYYALRGAADSFGIVTTFYFQTLPAPSRVVNYGYQFDLMNTTAGATPQAAAKAFLHLQDVARNASVTDRRNTWGIFIGLDTFNVRGVYNGTAADDSFQAFQTELLRNLPHPIHRDIWELSWMENNVMLGGNLDGTFNPPAPGTPGSFDTFFAKSAVVPESAPLTDATLRNYFSYLLKYGSNSSAGGWFSIINLYGGPDSQINARPSNFSAYSDRDALWVFQHYSSTLDQPFTTAAYDLVEGMNEALEYGRSQGVFEAYANYVDPSLDVNSAHVNYYGWETTERLQALKCKVDPGNVFWNPQAFVCPT